ncbi:MAG: quinol:cytochrome C oxidoreductase [Deltaproteobacteria bacterium]|jgi:hypothetical protein|nr:quinol:cytochrome C oxidoreductase [Deltaproteobacteria bacterium]MBT6433222.1 quinol:cytochrome C oxidoreductase [Deltaproteobacteria bacterium]
MGAHKTPEFTEEEITVGPKAASLMKVCYIVGAIALGISVYLGQTHDDHWKGFLYSYLVGFMYVLSIGLGTLFFVTLQHLTRAGWSVVIRRQAEFIAAALPVMFVLFLPILVSTLMGSHSLFTWNDHELAKTDHFLHVKEPYLNVGFFTVRALFFFAFWSVLAWFMLKISLKQDAKADNALTNLRENVSAPAMIFFALTLTFAAVDYIMALNYHWISTMIGVYYFAGAFMSCMAVLSIVHLTIQGNGKLNGLVTQEHYHDMGKLLFGFVFFWGYIGFSQFMLIWYANMPEGTDWFQVRTHGEWETYTRVLIAGHFFIPFVGLISRHAKRRVKILKFWAFWLLAMQWMDIYYFVMPNAAGHGHGNIEVIPWSLMDLTCTIGIAGIFAGTVFMIARGKKMVPVNDPRLPQCLSHEVM